MVATLVACFTLFFWIIAVSTSYWVIIDGGPSGIHMNHTRVTYLHGHMGLFRMCRSVVRHSWLGGRPSSEGAQEECRYFYVNPNKAEYSTDAMLDRTILEYTRSQIAFTCVSIFVIIMAIAFSMYTFTQQRYMFKRLAGGVYFIAAGVMLVMIEIESNNTNYEQNHFHQRHPFQAQWSFGLSYFLAWICLITFAAIGGLFIVYSRKRKLDIAADRGFSLS